MRRPSRVEKQGTRQASSDPQTSVEDTEADCAQADAVEAEALEREREGDVHFANTLRFAARWLRRRALASRALHVLLTMVFVLGTLSASDAIATCPPVPPGPVDSAIAEVGESHGGRKLRPAALRTGQEHRPGPEADRRRAS